MGETVRKEEVEELLQCEITDGQFREAFRYARHKQEHIFRQENRPEVMRHWYLVKLTEEYVRNLAFSRFTTDLCRTKCGMKKEHPSKGQGTPTSNHIVPVPAS